jgi:hypothetical protein
VLAGLSAQVHAARAEQEAIATEQVERAPFSSSERPALLGPLWREGKAFTRAFAKQLQSHLFPRAPALAGLAVGWWIARTYTDSRWRSVLRTLGIGEGGTRVVSSETLQAMNFWLPLCAAAICAYVGDRIARSLRHRYAPPADPGSSSPQILDRPPAG